MGRQTHRLAGNALINPIHLVEDHTRPHDSHPKFWPSLPFPHTRLCWFFGDRFVREYPNPDFTPTTHVAGHGDAPSLHLTAGNPRRVKSLQRILPGANIIPTSCLANPPTSWVFTKFRLFRHQHN